jgi:hypothetical protein
VSDTNNNRVLAWNSIPTTNGQAADYVLGQVDFVSSTANVGGSAGANTIKGARGLATDGYRFYVVDTGNNRILGFNSLPTTTFPSADFVFGQPGFTSGTGNAGGRSASSLSAPNSMFINTLGPGGSVPEGH